MFMHPYVMMVSIFLVLFSSFLLTSVYYNMYDVTWLLMLFPSDVMMVSKYSKDINLLQNSSIFMLETELSLRLTGYFFLFGFLSFRFL